MLYRQKEVDFYQKKHIDYDKFEQIFYDNLYFEGSNSVLKMPLISLIKNISYDDFKIEKFDLLKYVYLLQHE